MRRNAPLMVLWEANISVVGRGGAYGLCDQTLTRTHRPCSNWYVDARLPNSSVLSGISPSLQLLPLLSVLRVRPKLRLMLSSEPSTRRENWRRARLVHPDLFCMADGGAHVRPTTQSGCGGEPQRVEAGGANVFERARMAAVRARAPERKQCACARLFSPTQRRARENARCGSRLSLTARS